MDTLNVSPRSHRLQTIMPITVGNETKYTPVMDQSGVFIRPKEEIGSTVVFFK